MKEDGIQSGLALVPATGASSSGYRAATAPGSRELAPAVQIAFPSQWFLPARNLTHAQAVAELESLGTIFVKGADALSGLYLRIVEHIRTYDLDRPEVTAALRKAGLSDPRISDLRRIAAAPEEIYREYVGGAYGYRMALEKTRSYHQARRGKPQWKNRQLRRAAGRLIHLAKLEAMTGGAWEYELKGFKVRVFKP